MKTDDFETVLENLERALGMANIYLMENSSPNTTLKSNSFITVKFSLQFPKALNQT